jgi:hypothetical protein
MVTLPPMSELYAGSVGRRQLKAQDAVTAAGQVMKVVSDH